MVGVYDFIADPETYFAHEGHPCGFTGEELTKV